MNQKKKTSLIGYKDIHSDIVVLLEKARSAAARSVNSIMTATYWEIGRQLIKLEQKGTKRAEYGVALVEQLAADLTTHFGRGFTKSNLWNMRAFYLAWPLEHILQTPSGESSKKKTPKKSIGKQVNSIPLTELMNHLPLPWSAYVRLLTVKDSAARAFYEIEAMRAGWSVRQLDRQISSLFYERTALSNNKVAMLKRGSKAALDGPMTSEEAIKDPFVLEFLNLKDEYSENDLEAALIHRLEDFLFELGDDFAFIGRQRRLRVGNEWYRIDLLFFHRRLRSLIILDLKLGKFTHADAGQMHLYLNYAREHWMREGENPPIGLILCTQKDAAVARYALEGLPNKVIASEYKTVLPDADLIAEELIKARKILEDKLLDN
jgi:predicted nuclease of restriction endonuclease-like (RecB) superfamily